MSKNLQTLLIVAGSSFLAGFSVSVSFLLGIAYKDYHDRTYGKQFWYPSENQSILNNQDTEDNSTDTDGEE